MLRKLTSLFSVTALMFAMGASLPTKADDHEVVIGFAVALSGWMSDYDVPPLRGSELAVEEFNAQGGILGKQIRMVVSDTKTDNVQGAKAGADVVAKGAQFMGVSCDYDMGAPAATVADSHNMISISSCASDAKMGVQGIGPYTFTLNTYGQGEGAGMASFAWNKGWRKAYLLLDASIEYDKSICHGFLEFWKDLGGTVIGVDSYMQEDASIASQVTRYKELAASRGEPEFLYICSYGAGAVSAIRQIRGAGIDVAIGGGDSMDGDYWAAAIPGLSNHYAAGFGSIWGDDPRPEVNAFFDKYRAKFGDPDTSFPLNGYSLVEALKVAAERAGSLDSDAVLAEMNKFDKEPLLWGPTTYTADTHIDLTHVLTIIQIQNGQGSYAGKGTYVEGVPLPKLELIFPDFTEDLYDN
ncbi:MAG: ABC transporter substrate-binding protein [Pseudomonadota bacterium]|nr:ABC transporter substrate-binding protein [Pseudomonadota bacterium]